MPRGDASRAKGERAECRPKLSAWCVVQLDTIDVPWPLSGVLEMIAVLALACRLLCHLSPSVFHAAGPIHAKPGAL